MGKYSLQLEVFHIELTYASRRGHWVLKMHVFSSENMKKYILYSGTSVKHELRWKWLTSMKFPHFPCLFPIIQVDIPNSMGGKWWNFSIFSPSRRGHVKIPNFLSRSLDLLFFERNKQNMVRCKHQELDLRKYTIHGLSKPFLRIWCVTEGTLRHGGDITFSLGELELRSYCKYCLIIKWNISMGWKHYGGYKFSK